MTRKFDPTLGQYRDSGKFDGNDNQPAAGGMTALLEARSSQSIEFEKMSPREVGERAQWFQPAHTSSKDGVVTEDGIALCSDCDTQPDTSTPMDLGANSLDYPATCGQCHDPLTHDLTADGVNYTQEMIDDGASHPEQAAYQAYLARAFEMDLQDQREKDRDKAGYKERDIVATEGAYAGNITTIRDLPAEELTTGDVLIYDPNNSLSADADSDPYDLEWEVKGISQWEGSRIAHLAPNYGGSRESFVLNLDELQGREVKVQVLIP